MKKNLYLSILCLMGVCVITLSSACKKANTSPPLTCASVNLDSTGVGQIVYFTNCTKGATSSVWNFGDGDTSHRDTLYHVYYLPGLYTITLTTSNSNGAGIVKTFKILVTAYEHWTFKGIENYGSYVNINSFLNNAANNYIIYLSAPSDSFYALNYDLGSDLFISFTGNNSSQASFVDTVINGLQGPISNNQAAITISRGSNIYSSIMRGQTITVSHGASGKVRVAGINIKVATNYSSNNDTALVSFDLTN